MMTINDEKVSDFGIPEKYIVGKNPRTFGNIGVPTKRGGDQTDTKRNYKSP